jgi:tetratricopeptide (TPR) repeat protein
MKSWTILDIEPTDDIPTIKKAYAKKLKLHHPESDPEGYQALREAYDAAVKYAKSYKKSKNTADIAENTELMSQFTIEPELLSPSHIELPEIKPDPSPSIYEQNSDFLNQVEALYYDFNSRIEIDNWKTLLDSDLLWNLENKIILSRMLLDFFSSHHHLPKDIWILLEDTFKWCDKDNSIDNYNNSEFIIYIKKQLANPSPLSYSFLQIIEGVNYEGFLEHREKVQDNIMTGNIAAAKYHLEQAKKLYTDDPDLLRLEGITYLLSEDLINAYCAFEKALTINTEDSEALRYIITAYCENNQTAEALEAYKYLYPESTDTNDLPLFVAKIYFKLGALDKAKIWALKAVKTFPPQNEANILLSQIYANLRKKLSKALAEDPTNQELKNKLDAVDSEVFRRTSSNSQLENTKAEPKSAIETIKSVFKIVLALLILLISIALIFVSRLGIVVVIILVVKKFVLKKGK